MSARKGWVGSHPLADEPSFSKLDDALDRGYNPHPDDMLPPAAHLALDPDDPWAIALRASVKEARRLQRIERGA